jgi:hypothetical protein
MKICFINDVSFGVLHEKKKASEKLQLAINQTLNKKIVIPLDTLLKTLY